MNTKKIAREEKRVGNLRKLDDAVALIVHVIGQQIENLDPDTSRRVIVEIAEFCRAKLEA
jgi:hypothetical protein